MHLAADEKQQSALFSGLFESGSDCAGHSLIDRDFQSAQELEILLDLEGEPAELHQAAC